MAHTGSPRRWIRNNNPKYHCELNYIEMIWGWAKSHHRRTCTYNYKDLKARLPENLINCCQWVLLGNTYSIV